MSNVGVLIDGELVMVPGVFPEIDVSAVMPAIPGYSGVILAIGTSGGGDPSHVYTFRSPEEAKTVIRDGGILSYISRMFDPAPGIHGASIVKFIRANTARSQGTLQLGGTIVIPPPSMDAIYYSLGTKYANFMPFIHNIPAGVAAIEFDDEWNGQHRASIPHNNGAAIQDPLTGLAWAPGARNARGCCSWVDFPFHGTEHPAGLHHITATMRDAQGGLVDTLYYTYDLHNSGDFRLWVNDYQGGQSPDGLKIIRSAVYARDLAYPEWNENSDTFIEVSGPCITPDPWISGQALTPTSDNFINSIDVSAESSDPNVVIFTGFMTWGYPLFWGQTWSAANLIVTHENTPFGNHNITAHASSGGVTHTISVPFEVISGFRMQASGRYAQNDGNGTNNPYYLFTLDVLASDDIPTLTFAVVPPEIINNWMDDWTFDILTNGDLPDDEATVMDGAILTNSFTNRLFIKATPPLGYENEGGIATITVSSATSALGPVSLTSHITIPSGIWA
jgi:hypothetical protein